MNVGKMAKAIVAAVAAGSATLVTAVSDGVFSTGDVVTVVLSVLGSLGVVWAVPNAAASDDYDPKHAA